MARTAVTSTVVSERRVCTYTETVAFYWNTMAWTERCAEACAESWGLQAPGHREVSAGLGHRDRAFHERTIERPGQCGSRVRW
jgi:hypothetical protein